MVTKRKRNRQSTFPRQNANWGLPKTERLKRLCVMPKGDKSQASEAREMTLKIRHGNGASIVVSGLLKLRRGIVTLTWRRDAVKAY